MKRYIVIGVGQFGFSVARTLVELGCDVLAIDQDEGRVQEISDLIPHSVVANGTDEKAMRALGAQEYDTAIVTCGESLENSILATVILREIGVPEVIVKAVNPKHGDILKRIGATKVIYPEQEMGEHLANHLVNPDILQEIALSRVHSIKELSIPEELIGESILEGNIRAKYGITILAIRSQGAGDKEGLLLSPPPTYVFKEGDLVVLFGKNEDIENFREGR
ncbi:MAG TPA: TrkA family potassium uptake protein [Candidatus Sumerlaeota bacterium]|jgi:trk system potassium uptake protein TrkA|nr:MAG: Ktr system potassium uptake protein A [candidate division BRC1 bacterium ADurb.Bin183]HOE64545.1 TrkA family potassium uptake protein [Candidatus Sumerlaeota bacterium]HRR32366.1 TrkA family potassium uptake protein [Candidatus Sumerlaeia bacterium]HON49720.1 TrkA family potassium uptake protein [Candidatus Sumerlaeota bacterium]HOR64032.1 TrkA family potassium uptake protein [Candidatus Sumerlaeota bacterium]